MSKQDSDPAAWPPLSAFDSRMFPNTEAALQRRREQESQRQRASEAHARALARPNPYSRKPLPELAKALTALRGERTYGAVGGPTPFANSAGIILAGAIEQGFLSGHPTFSAVVLPALQRSYGSFYERACDFFLRHAADWGYPPQDTKTADIRRRVENGTLILVRLLEAARPATDGLAKGTTPPDALDAAQFQAELDALKTRYAGRSSQMLEWHIRALRKRYDARAVTRARPATAGATASAPAAAASSTPTPEGVQEKSVAPAEPRSVPDTAENGAPPTPSRIWTQPHCPSCGRTPIEFISASAFENQTRADGKAVTRETAGTRIKAGKYWHDGNGEIPWCAHCRVKTPLGPGVATPVNGVPKYRPSQIECRQAFVWCAELVAKTFHLPKPDMDLQPSEADSREVHDAYEYANEGASAVLEDAASRGAMPMRDEAEKVAVVAIRKYRERNFESRMYESRGDMEHPAQESEANDE